MEVAPKGGEAVGINLSEGPDYVSGFVSGFLCCSESVCNMFY